MPSVAALHGLVLAVAGPALVCSAALSALSAPAAAMASVPSVAGTPTSPGSIGAACPPGTGVTVVVDFGPLGGGTRTGCAPDPSGSGTGVLRAAGFEVTGVTSQPGFVCRLEGRPAADVEDCRRTPPADAYWGLFVADRAGAPWTYATVGLAALEPAAGSFLGLRFQNGSSRVPPGRERLAGPAPTRGGDSAADAVPSTGRTVAGAAADGDRGSGTALVPVAAVLVAGLLAAAYVVARRRRAG